MITRSDSKIVPAGADRFDIDIDNSTGLYLRVKGGVILNGLGYLSVANATLTLTASTFNYVEMTDAGAIVSNATSFTAGYTSLYIVTTGATVVTGIEDHRGSGRDANSQTFTASGAIREDVEVVYLNKTTPLLAITIAAPRAGRRLLITQIDSGTAGHTVTLAAGTWDGSATIATFNALGETLEVVGLTAIRFGIIANIQSVALS